MRIYEEYDMALVQRVLCRFVAPKNNMVMRCDVLSVNISRASRLPLVVLGICIC